MRVDRMSLGGAPADLAEAAAAAERHDYDGWFAAETSHDPFISLTLAAVATRRIKIGTGIAVAFARSPMDVAYSAHDLQQLTRGRFVLGLGSQVAAHIRKRFAMPWSSPAARMREYVAALRAIWGSWRDGTPLDFRGDFYQHTLMPPFFAPGDHGHGPPPVYLAAVGPLMTRVAGEVCDGVLCHSFTTERYLREVTLPAVEEGARRAGRSATDVAVNLGVFLVCGYDDRQRADAEAFVRRQIAFYGSTPAYRPVLERHGWQELGEELTALAKRGAWDQMPGLIDDDVLDAFAVVCSPQQAAARIRSRYGDVVDRISLYTTFQFTDDDRTALLTALRD